MKKIVILGLALLLWGCGSEAEENKLPEKERLVESSIYSVQGGRHNLSVEEFYPLRLAAVNEGEIEKVVFVKGNQDEAVEVTVTGQAEIDKIAAYFKSVNLGNETTSLGPGNWVDFEITLKGKEPVYFRFNQFGVCDGMCLKADKFEELEILVNEIKGDEKEVAGMPVYDDFMAIITWPDVLPIIPNNYVNYIDEEGLIRDAWLPEENPAYQILRLVNYINEDFDDYSDISDVNLLTAGIIQQAIKYDCFEETENVCKNHETGDLLYFPKGKPGAYKVQPDVYEAVPYINVEKAGKAIFSNTYTLPELGEGHMLYQSLQGYNHSPADQLFFYHLPYEAWFPDMNSFYILDEKNEGDLSIFIVAKITESFKHTGEMPTPVLIGKNGYEIDYTYEESKTDLIQENQEHFEKWEYVLKKEADGYRIISGYCLNRSNPPIVPVDPAEDAYYLNEQGLLTVNLASKDAALFNEWVENQKASGNSYKANVHNGLLSIWISENHNDAVVFDIATGMTLNTEEVIKYLNIKTDKLIAAVKAIPEYKDTTLSLNDGNAIGEFKTSKIFINSKGKLAFDFDYNGIILFEWEEVR